MSNPHITAPIALVGMMGAGKSSVGRRLAGRLDLPFVDSDTEVERSAKRSIPSLFAREGEAAFRVREREAIAECLGSIVILATGGGAMAHPETRALLLEKAVTVWLDVPAEAIAARVEGSSHRPLLEGPNSIAEILARRRPFYAQATHRIDANASAAAVAARIMELL